MRMYSIDLHCKILLDIIPISLYVGYRVNTLYIFSYFQNFSWKEWSQVDMDKWTYFLSRYENNEKDN